MRTYDDSCGIARALDAVGERWALLVVRELLLGPKRFGQLRRGLPGMSPNVLSQRLRELEEAGIVHKYELDPPASVLVYELTERGRELAPVLHTLGRWGSQQPLSSGNELSVDALLVALETMFSPTLARDLDAAYQLVVDGDAYQLRIADGEIDIRRGRASEPAATLDTDRATLRGLALGGASLDEAVSRGAAAASGSKRALTRLLRLFPTSDRRATIQP